MCVTPVGSPVSLGRRRDVDNGAVLLEEQSVEEHRRAEEALLGRLVGALGELDLEGVELLSLERIRLGKVFAVKHCAAADADSEVEAHAALNWILARVYRLVARVDGEGAGVSSEISKATRPPCTPYLVIIHTALQRLGVAAPADARGPAASVGNARGQGALAALRVEASTAFFLVDTGTTAAGTCYNHRSADLAAAANDG